MLKPKIGSPNLPDTKTSAEPQAPVKMPRKGGGRGNIANLGHYAHPMKKKGRKK